MTYLFVSDVHLSADRPQIAAQFVQFLDEWAGRAEQMFILGDLFDFWLGDDDERPPHTDVMSALRRLTDSGTPTAVAHGNHDFLLGRDFVSRTGCRILDDPETVDIFGQRTLLMHGDSLCTSDLEYQAFRRFSRDPSNQAAFLSLPLPARLEQAKDLRSKSKAATSIKADDIMDVSEDAVRGALLANDCTVMIHGHTHRPNVHQVDMNSGDGDPTVATGTRIVLGDWYEHDDLLAWGSDGWQRCRVSDLARVFRDTNA